MRGIIHKYFIGLFLIVVFPDLSLGQMDTFPCESGNEKLRALLEGKTVESLYVHNCGGEGMSSMATSFLKPTGSGPKRVDDPSNPAWGRYESWTCRYNPGNISDKNLKTAWVEGLPGQGIGELVLVACLDFSKPIKIWNGYGKSSKLYLANSRVKTARLYIIRGKMTGATEYGFFYGDVTTVAQSTVALKDKNAYQVLSVPAFEKESYYNTMMKKTQEYAYFLGIEILEVYKGTKYDDTCITEVSN